MKADVSGTAVYGTVRTVVWEDGGGDPASYPIAKGLVLAVLCRTPLRKEDGLFSVGDGSFAVETGPTCFANIRFL